MHTTRSTSARSIPSSGPRPPAFATADCPRYTLRRDPTGHYVEADVELYFTVNGAELRPAGGGTFRGTFQDYLGAFAVCVTP